MNNPLAGKDPSGYSIVGCVTGECAEPPLPGQRVGPGGYDPTKCKTCVSAGAGGRRYKTR
jgi:hypothetical protein